MEGPRARGRASAAQPRQALLTAEGWRLGIVMEVLINGDTRLALLSSGA